MIKQKKINTFLFKPSDDQDNSAASTTEEVTSWILTNPNPSPSTKPSPSPNLNPKCKVMEMLFGNVDPYLEFNYATPAMDSVVLVQAKLIGGAFGNASKARRWGFW